MTTTASSELRSEAQASFSRTSIKLSEVEKATVILAALGPKLASMLLEGMDRAKVRRFAQAVHGMNEIEADVVDQVISEFLSRLSKDGGVVGGDEEARRFLSEVMDKQQVDQLMDDLQIKGRSVWAALSDIADARLLASLRSEHPQVIAIILTKLTSAKTARLLEQLDPVLARRMVLRMGQASSVTTEVVQQISGVIEREFLPAVTAKKGKMEPPDLIAAVMNHVSSGVRDELMEHMETASPALAEAVRKLVFTYEDIPARINRRDVSLIVKAVDEGTLLVALKSPGEAAAATAEFILSNISSRLATRLKDDLGEIPAPKRKEGEAAKSAIVAEIVEMRDRGLLKLLELDAGEQ